jgi:small-conductance mechanosensitive channel
MNGHSSMRPWFRIFRLAIAGLLCCFAGVQLSGQDQPAIQLDRDALLGHLNTVITWYRDITSKVQPTGLPSDAIYQDNAQNLGGQVVRLAFQSARAEADLVPSSAKAAPVKPGTGKGSSKSAPITKADPKARTNADSNPSPSATSNPNADSTPANEGTVRRQNLAQTLARVSSQIDDAQQKLDEVNKALPSAGTAKRRDLVARRERLQEQLALNKAMLDAIQKLSAFMEGGADDSDDLDSAIDQLARSVPEVLGSADDKKSLVKAAPQSAPAPGNSSGLIGQSLTLFGQIRSMHDIDQVVGETNNLRDTVNRVRKPLRDTLTATIRRGRELALQSDATSAQPDVSPQEFQTLTARFKELSAATLPLAQELLVIEQIRVNFQQWRKSILDEMKSTVRALATRVLGIALALAGVFVLSEVWRRLTFRYVHDARRRRQFLVMRRFVTGFLVGVVLIMGFVSEFSSLATFAGFVTAGIAVGLQGVLLSIAAYFFVVGRYGIRVSDRISVAGVTGDVIDIGLVRLYLMELAGTGIDLYPTGRVVMFSNSVLFQAGMPLFKQIPGTEYAWHEVVASLNSGSNYKLVQDKFFSAVNTVYEKYRAGIENQLGSIERRLEVQLKAPVPEAKLQFADAGLEFVVRYPVDIRRASEIDDQVTRAVLKLLDEEQELKVSVMGSPKIRAAIKG